MRKLILGLFLLLFLSSCECTYQYGVYVMNDTREEIVIKYQTDVDIDGPKEEALILGPGEQKRIIYTENLDTDDGCGGTRPDHCKMVAEYIQAFLRDTIPSTINWCDPSIKFEKTDIQQAEFTIVYTEEDFNY